MKITVFGASGATGRHLVTQALAAHHDVTAFVRSASSLPVTDPRLRIVVGGLDQADTVQPAVQGADAVISVLGVRKTGAADVCTKGVSAILKAMARQPRPAPTHTCRLVVLSAYGAGDTADTSLAAWLIRRLLAAKMRDKDQMEALVSASDVDWTVVRPPALTNGPLTGKYVAGVGLKIGFFARLSRADLAQFMLSEAVDGQYIGKAPTVAS